MKAPTKQLSSETVVACHLAESQHLGTAWAPEGEAIVTKRFPLEMLRVFTVSCVLKQLMGSKTGACDLFKFLLNSFVHMFFKEGNKTRLKIKRRGSEDQGFFACLSYV